MRHDVVYRVYGVHEGREKNMFLGAFRTLAEAESSIAELRLRVMHGKNWSEQYHDLGFVVRKFVVDTDFEIPTRPKPRDRYFVRGRPMESQGGSSANTVVEVFRRGVHGSGPQKVCEYERNYGMLLTFEPFRQSDRDFALISPQYTGTSVLDLTTGRVIAAEPADPKGFCPVGFYVPDWWDQHDGSVIPGSEHWNSDFEWLSGRFGFVWGCVWGDDRSWKIQYLDLSDIQSGVIRRDERFGYVELATQSHWSPCFDPQIVLPEVGSDPPPFVRARRRGGVVNVTLAVEMLFDLESGRPSEWQRTRTLDFE